MTCKTYENRLDELEDYFNGRLEPARARALQAHVASCDACREALELTAMGARLVRAAVEPVPAASGPFWTRMSALVREEEAKRSARRDFFGSLEWLAWRTVSAAVLLAVVLAGYVATHPSLPQESDQQMVGVFQEPEHPQNADEVLVTLSARRNGR